MTAIAQALHDAGITAEELGNDSHEGKLIFEGKIATRTDAIAEITARQIAQRGTAYYDLIPELKDLLTTPMLRARVLSSMAWTLDVNIINTARSVFYDTYKDVTETQSIDGMSDFISAMSEMRANENYMEDLGFELNTGRLQSLTMMLHLSREWHDAAESAAVDANMKYSAKTFAELLASEKPQQVDTLSRTKIRALVRAMVLGDEEAEFVDQCEADNVLDQPRYLELLAQLTEAETLMIKKQEEDYRQMFEQRQKVSPAVERIIQYGSYRDCDDANFWQLAVDTQYRLIQSASRTVQRVMQDLASYKSIPMVEYLVIIKESKAAIKALNEVLASPKFKNI